MTAASQQRTRPQTPAPAEFFEVHERTILELQTAQAEGRVTSRGLVDAYLARIAAYDQSGPRLNAIVVLNPRAREEAEALDRERARTGPRGPLHGIPVLVKDNYDTVDMPTSGGALGLATMQPAVDAFQVKRLRAAGAVILGKTTMHELAAGIVTISSLTGQTRNPYDLMRVPGGSSGGTGAARGRELCGRRHGQRHVRIDPHSSGEPEPRWSALRPVASRVARAWFPSPARKTRPAHSRGPSRISPSCSTPRWRPIQTMPSPPRALGTCPKSYRDTLTAGRLKGARIGVLRGLFGSAPEDEEVGELMRKSLDAMKTQGAEVIDVVVPGMDDLLRDASVINDEFKFDLAAYLARHPNAPVKSLGEIIERGLHHDALDQTFRLRNAPEKKETEHYRQALLKRRALREAVEVALEVQRVDALAYPTLRRKPTLIGEAQVGHELSTQRGDRTARDLHAGGVHRRWSRR